MIRSALIALVSSPVRALRWMMLTRPIRFTRFGTLYVLFAIGVGAAAINTGNNLLYLMLGILLGFIVISGFLSDSCLWGIRTAWRPMESGYAGQPLNGECEVKKGWFPAVAVALEASWDGAPPSRLLAPWVSARGSERLAFTVTPRKRGWLSLRELRYSTRFPFGLFEKSHRETPQERWLVYPRIRRIPRTVLAYAGIDARRPVSAHPGPGVVPFLLRDFRSGDAPRMVHWKLTAKRQRLIIKEMEDDSDGGDWLQVSRWPAVENEERMEAFISFLASLAFSLYEDGRPVGLQTPDIRLAPERTRAHLHRLLHYLALVDPGRSASFSSPGKSPEPALCIDVVRLWSERDHDADRQ